MARRTIKVNFGTIKSLSVMIYFIMLITHHLFDNECFNYVWYIVFFFCITISLLCSHCLCKKQIIVFLAIYTPTSFVNIIMTGNNTFSQVVFTYAFLCIYILLTERDISEKSLYWSILVSCFLVIGKIMKTGVGESIFDELSNNYISVFLLMPTMVYYIRGDVLRIKVSALPAVLVWISCCLAVGRGGILTSSILVVGVLFFLCFSRRYKTLGYRKHRLLIGIAIIIGVVLVATNIQIVINSVVFQRFLRFGFYGTGRGAMWLEYINELKNIESIIWGVDFDNLVHMIRYKNNLHNSFLNIHANNGIFMLGYVIGCIYQSSIAMIKRGNWISFVCICVFFLRSFTDKIFWGSISGTPVFFFVLWASYLREDSQSMLEIRAQ